MCGIVGILTSGEVANPDYIDRMVRALGHRGPDDSSVVIDGEMALGHTRLSIVDVSNGQQPMSTWDDFLSITFNGEIFNHVELRQMLMRRGHSFRTRSDTEVLLHLYQEYGPDCVHQLNGQWAFAVWDSRERRLFLSRDRMGVRPLYYSQTAETFLFASEIKALFAHPHVDRRLDVEALDQVFTFWAPVPPRTMFRGVCELPPGHSMMVERGRVHVTRYWQPQYEWHETQRTESDYADELLSLLSDATKLRLRADVPIGAYLSGGLDSTIITALIKRVVSLPLRTFSIGFDHQDYDESSYQRIAAQHLDTQHDEVRCTSKDIGTVFPDVVWHAEKPLLRTAPAPMFLLSRRVRDASLKVVLTGEGADEVFGGYDIFKESKIRLFWARAPQSKIRPRLLRRLYPYMKNLQAQPEAYLRAFFRTSPADLGDPFFSHLPRWSLTSQLKRLYSSDLKTQLGSYDAVDEMRQHLPLGFAAWDPFVQAQYLETSHLLPSYILSSQGDRMSMGHSVEGRFPFLDHRVVEFGNRLPPRMKMKVLNEKMLLKRAVRGLIPEQVRSRTKQPYRAPDAVCFFPANEREPEFVTELLSSARLHDDGLFDAAAVGHLITKARSGRDLGVKDNMGIVGILSTQILINRFIRNSINGCDANRDSPVRHRQLSVRAGSSIRQ